MSAEHASGDEVRHPDHGDVEERLGAWPTIAGETPTAKQLTREAERITAEETDVETTEQLAMQSLRYVWRRQKMPHSKDWKEAEAACEDVLEVTRR